MIPTPDRSPFVATEVKVLGLTEILALVSGTSFYLIRQICELGRGGDVVMLIGFCSE